MKRKYEKKLPTMSKNQGNSEGKKIKLNEA